MSTKKVILIVVVVVIIILGLAGTIAGYVFNKGALLFENNKKKEKVEKYYLSLDSIYCNIKDSKKCSALR